VNVLTLDVGRIVDYGTGHYPEIRVSIRVTHSTVIFCPGNAGKANTLHLDVDSLMIWIECSPIALKVLALGFIAQREIMLVCVI
jgi:hypothetical protein